MREAVKEVMVGLALLVGIALGAALVVWVPVAGVAFAECGTEAWIDRLSGIPLCPSQSDIND